MKNGDKPAFAVLHSIDGNWVKEPLEKYQGLTKREYFAAMAMHGLLANPELFRIASEQKPEVSIDIYSKAAIEHADDLLKQLEP